MKDLLSWYNRNRTRIWITIFFILFVFLAIKYLQNLWLEQNRKDTSRSQTTTINNKNKDNLNSVTVLRNSSPITGGTSPTVKEDNKLLNDFVSYCNSGNTEKAYELISDECKEVLYPTIQDFEEKYYNVIFSKVKRTVDLENWFNKTYKVNFYEDALSTGNYSKDSKVQDYITIVKTNDNVYKLNINGYIKRDEINREKSINNIKIKVIYSDIYSEYESYTFEITNNSDKKIALGNVEKYDFTYLEDLAGHKYDSYATELTQEELVIARGETKKITIKYFSKYVSSKNIERVSFSNIILDYDNYKKDRGNYTNYKNISIGV